MQGDVRSSGRRVNLIRIWTSVTDDKNDDDDDDDDEDALINIDDDDDHDALIDDNLSTYDNRGNRIVAVNPYGAMRLSHSPALLRYIHFVQVVHATCVHHLGVENFKLICFKLRICAQRETPL